MFLSLTNCAVATSGDAWQFVEIDGRRYSHIVDPQTGLGLTERSSITLVAPNCTTADAWASAVSVLGIEKGVQQIEALKDTEVLIVREVEGKTSTARSSRFDKLPQSK